MPDVLRRLLRRLLPDRPAGRPSARAGAPELRGRGPRALLGLALALPVLLVVGTLIASSVLRSGPAPAPGAPRLAVPPVAVPAAATADCNRLLTGLPALINTGGGMLPRATLADPVPAATVAWGGSHAGSGRAGDQPLVLRCGVPAPPGLTPTSTLSELDGVAWLPGPGPRPGVSTWTVVDRAVYVTLTLPDDSGTGALQEISRGVKITLASRPSPPG